MSVQGIIFLDLVALAVLVEVLDLTRRGRLYVGYGVIFVVAIVGAVIVISVPPLSDIVTNLLSPLAPVPGLPLLAFGFTFVMLIYVLTQTTVMSNRLAEVVQQLAIQQIRASADKPAAEPAAHEPSEE
jgi:hypothetical protein